MKYAIKRSTKKNELAVHKKKHAAVSAEPFSESTMPVMAYTEAVDTGEKDDSPVAEVVSVPSISSVEATQVLLSPLTPAKEAIPDEVHVASETQDFEQYDGGYDDYTNADVTEENIISELKASDVTVESACAASGADLPEEGSIYRDIEIERGLPPATELSVAQTDGAALASVANPVAKVEKIRRGPVRKETSGFCTYCNKNFKALVNHQRVKHLGLFSNHACDHCSMIFANGDYLERHLLNSHGIGTSGRSNRKKARIDDGIAVLGQIVDALEGLLALDGLSDL